MNTTIKTIIRSLSEQFSSISDTPRLDAEILLIHALQKPREFLFAHPEYEPSKKEITIINQCAQRRDSGEPVAHITGHKEFWSLDLTVTSDTLIPRPETECLVEWVLNTFPRDKKLTIADLGTGSGAIAIALAHEQPHWIIHATDISEQAVVIAKQNAKRYQLNNIVFYSSRWFAALPQQEYDIIVANPPYVASNDPHLKQLQFEPQSALESGKDGLDDIRIIINNASGYLVEGGTLAFEHGCDQGNQVQELLQQAGFQGVELHHDLADLPRFTTAKRV